jgi:competence protein ComEC
VSLGLISGDKALEITKRPLIAALLFFILGIIAGRFVFPHNQWISISFIFLISILAILTICFPYFSSRTLVPFSILFFIGIVLSQNAGIQYPRLLQLAEGHKKIVLEGTVLSPGSVANGRSKFDFMVESSFIDQVLVPVKEKVTVTIYNNAIDFDPGQRIRFPASLKSFRNFNNPGRYDYESNMSLRGYSCAASMSDGRTVVMMAEGKTGAIIRTMESIRRPIRKLMISNLETVDQAVYRALILGEMQGIDDNIRESFNVTGLGHVLSVSGLHVGLVAVVSFILFRFLFSRSYALTLRIDIKKLSAFITCLCVFAYTFIAGFQVSANRSMIMAITYLFSIIVGKEKDAWSTLALAAIIVLSLDPNDLFNISFQLSFIAVIGIFWLSPYIYRLIKDKFNELERGRFLSRVCVYFSSLFIIGISAVICSLPFTTYYFHRIQLLAVPINLIVEPLLGLWILPVGILSVVILPVSYSLSCLVLKMGAFGLDVMMNIIRFWSQFDWISVWVVTPDILEIALYYCIIFFLIFTFKKRRWAQIGLAIALIISIFDISYWVYDTHFNPNFRVTFLDVGQGNSAFIQFPGGKSLLLDGGGFANNTFDTGGLIVAPFLFQSKIHCVDYLVLSHPHPDHMNGMKFIAEHFNPKKFLFNGQKINSPEFTGLMDALKKNNTSILLPEDLAKGIDINGVRVELLHPLTSPESSDVDMSKEDSGTNNNSLVLKFSYKGSSFLFTGDIQAQGEETVVTDAGPRLKSDVLLVPHHGSRYSSTMPFIKAVSPRVAIISCGKENSFGFPSKETLQRWSEAESKILRIDEWGAITIEVTSKGMNVKRFIKPDQPDRLPALF